MKRDVPHFRIGLLLTEAGILAPKQLDDAIQQGEQSGIPFLRVLVSSGELKQHELQAVIRAQSLIWSGLLDVEHAIQALTIVHGNDVSIDEGLRDVGWVRAEGSMAETVTGAVSVKVREAMEASAAVTSTNGSRPCQYCGTLLDRDSTLCPFCTGENMRPPAPTGKFYAEPAWQRQLTVSGDRLIAPSPARDPGLMAFFSGCCVAGLGQIILGQTAKGSCLMLLAIVLAFVTGCVSSLIVFPLAAIDAFLLADKLRNGKSIGPWEFF
jgi:TM2 domain-containing membrane protein YozV